MAVLTSVAVLMSTTLLLVASLLVSASASAMTSPAAVSTGSSVAQLKPGSTWTFEVGGRACQNVTFSKHRAFVSLDASGDLGSYTRSPHLKMTWTSGPAAGDVFKATFRKSQSHYEGRFYFDDESAAPALLVPAGTIACSTVSSAPTDPSVVAGTPDTDTATVTALGPAPTGTVSFSVCGPFSGDTACTPDTGTSLGAPVDLSAATPTPTEPWTATATSPSFSPTTPGTYCFVAVYSGDTSYPSGSDGSPADECITVTPALMTPTITTAVTSSSIVLGQSDTDTATVTGDDGAAPPSGTVTFTVCGPETTAACTTTRQVGSPVTLGAALTGPQSMATSAPFTPEVTGVYCFSADYSGDDAYAPVSDTSSPPAECVTVTAAPPAVPLGSAENSFGTGNLDLGAGPPTNIWAAVNGYCTSKENGDEFLSGFDGTFNGSGYNCDADQTAPTIHAAANPEYSATGYVYDIVTPVATGTLDQTITVQAYDAGYNPAADPSTDGNGNGCAAPGSGPSPDNAIGVVGTQITTNFTLSYNPVPGDPSQNQILNTYSAGTNDQGNCGQWVTIGNIPAGSSNGTYQLDVATEQDQFGSEGTNAYGLRVFQGPSFVRCSTIPDPGWSNPLGQTNDCPVIHGDNALSVYANQAGSTGDFYLAQVPTSGAGDTLTVNLFDPGEGDHYIELIDPDGDAVPFFWQTTDDGLTNPICPDCAADFGFLHYAGPPNGTTQLDVSGQITPPTGVTSHSIFNDRHVALTFFIPPNYSADNGGWWKIRYIANSGSISDRMTFSVSLSAPSTAATSAAKRKTARHTHTGVRSKARHTKSARQTQSSASGTE